MDEDIHLTPQVHYPPSNASVVSPNTIMLTVQSLTRAYARVSGASRFSQCTERERKGKLLSGVGRAGVSVVFGSEGRFPNSLLEFQGRFATEGVCAEYLFERRWGAVAICVGI